MKIVVKTALLTGAAFAAVTLAAAPASATPVNHTYGFTSQGTTVAGGWHGPEVQPGRPSAPGPVLVDTSGTFTVPGSMEVCHTFDLASATNLNPASITSWGNTAQLCNFAGTTPYSATGLKVGPSATNPDVSYRLWGRVCVVGSTADATPTCSYTLITGTATAGYRPIS